ncbi:MAG: DUF4097 domain-containing protein [Chloroflexota bacterium]
MNTTIGSTAELEHHIGPKGRFSLKVPSGSVVIRGTDEDVARIRDMRGRSLAERFSIDAGTDHLSLEARTRFGLGFEFGGRGSEDRLEIDVPRWAVVIIDTASADVEAANLAGQKRFKSASGDLTLDDVSGDLDVEAVSGDVTVSGSNRLDLRARTISGDLVLRAPSVGRFEAGTTSGDLRLDAELTGAGPFAIKSISGDVTITARGALSVDAQTITGELSTSMEHRSSSAPGHKALIIGRDGPTLQFKSVSGDLRIVEAREAPAPQAGRDPDTEDFGDPPPAGMDASEASDASATDEPVDSTDLAAARLDILRALERGELTVDAATERLAELEGAVR